MYVKRYIRKSGQSGQSIILIALAMVGLLGFVALAIDNGHEFVLRRDGQNRIDSATGAGAGAICLNSGDPKVEAQKMTDPYPASFSTKQTDVINKGYSYYDFSGTVTEKAWAGIYQVVGIKVLVASASATSRCQKPMYASDNYAIVATGTTCNNTANFSGQIVTINGNVWTNSDCKFTNSPKAIVNGQVYYVTICQNPNTEMNPSQNNPSISSGAVDFPSIDVTRYAPGGVEAIRAQAEGVYYYSSGRMRIGTPGGAPTQVYGLYFAEGDLDLNNVYGTATFVTRTGTIHFSGSGANLTAYTTDGEAIVSASPAKNCGSSDVTITVSSYTITGYIDAAGIVSYSGSSGVQNGHVRGYVVNPSGSDMTFNGDNIEWFGPTGWGLHQ